MPIIDEILNLHVIIQGAIGSALFALIASLLKVVFKFITHQLSKISNKIDIENKNAEWVHLQYQNSDRNADSAIFLVWCIFHGFHHIIQALIWVVLGQIFKNVIELFALIGYLGALYYLYRAVSTVPFKDEFEDLPDEYQKRAERIEQLSKELGK